jgi:hypothetical protein
MGTTATGKLHAMSSLAVGLLPLPGLLVGAGAMALWLVLATP